MLVITHSTGEVWAVFNEFGTYWVRTWDRNDRSLAHEDSTAPNFVMDDVYNAMELGASAAWEERND